jgi:hypothetical protein
MPSVVVRIKTYWEANFGDDDAMVESSLLFHDVF